MPEENSIRKPVVDWLTFVAIAVIAISFTIAIHEGVHVFTCLAVGGDLEESSALYESCASPIEWQVKVVAGSAPNFSGMFL